MFSYLWKNLSNMFSWQRFATSLPMVSNWFELIFFFPHISIKFLCLAAESVDQLLKWILIGHQQFSIEPYFLGTKESFFWKFVAEADISFCRIFCSSTLLKKRVLRHLLHFIEEVFESHSSDLTTIEPILICKQTVYLCATQPEFPKSSKFLVGLLAKQGLQNDDSKTMVLLIKHYHSLDFSKANIWQWLHLDFVLI